MNRRRRRRRKRTAPTLAPAKKFVYSCAACAGPGQRNGRKAQRPARSLGPKRRPRAAARNEARGQTSAIRARAPSAERGATRHSGPLGPAPPHPQHRPHPWPERPPRRPTPSLKDAPPAAAPWPSEPTKRRAAPLPPTFPARPNGPQRGQRNQSTQLKPTQRGQNAKPKTAASPSDARKTERRRNCGMPKSAGPMRPARIACAEA